MIKLARFGILSTVLYILFFIFAFFENILSGNFIKHIHEFNLFTNDVSGICGKKNKFFNIFIGNFTLIHYKKINGNKIKII